MKETPGKINQAAADWLLELGERGTEPAVLEDWMAWMEADPRHERAFEHMQRLWDTSADVDWSRVEAMRAAARARSASARRRRRRWLGAAAVACCALVAVLALYPDRPPGGDGGAVLASTRIDTGVGEVREAMLDDGSHVLLGGASRVEVQIGPDIRGLRLLEGSAEFSVVRDPARPFVVDAGQARVEVLGTRFRVHQRADRTVIEVAEGRVRVTRQGGAGDALELVSGEAVSVDSAHGSMARQAALLDEGNWSGTDMIYRDEPLSNLVADLNRYASKPFRLAPEVDAGIPISGRWRMDMGDARIAELLAAVGLQAEPGGEVILLRPRSGPGHR